MHLPLRWRRPHQNMPDILEQPQLKSTRDIPIAIMIHTQLELSGYTNVKLFFFQKFLIFFAPHFFSFYCSCG